MYPFKSKRHRVPVLYADSSSVVSLCVRSATRVNEHDVWIIIVNESKSKRECVPVLCADSFSVVSLCVRSVPIA